MATVYTDAFLKLGATTMSGVKSVEIKASYADQETTVHGGGGWTTSTTGLGSWEVTAELMLDYGSGSTEATLWSILGQSTSIEIRPTSSAVSASNPKFTGTAILFELPEQLSVGEVGTVSITLKGTGALTRATS